MLRKTPLDDWHREHGAKLVEFGGWRMPVSYEGMLAEHRAVRERCGLFDISHMGEIYIKGPGAGAFLQTLATNDVARLKDGCAQYSLLLNEGGTVIDDIIVYRLKADRFLLCVNASNTDKDLAWLQSHRYGELSVEDRSDSTGMIALQGPNSSRVLRRFDFDLGVLRRFEFVETKLAGVPLLLSRTGYTGEEGCEMFLQSGDLLNLWEALLDAGISEGIRPIGLGARDILRLEMGYPLYGHEISDEINPLEAGLDWVVKERAGDFIGKSALLSAKQQGLKLELWGLVMAEPGIPREGFKVFAGGEEVGRTRSGNFSPSLQVGIATALLKRNLDPESGEIFIDIRGKMKKAHLQKLPFLKIHR